MKTRFLVVALVAGWLFTCHGFSQDESPWVSSPRRALTAPESLDAPDEWIERSLGWANEILDKYAPGVPEHPVRRAALIRLDDILHIESAPAKPLVQRFFQERMETAVRDIEQTTVTEGMRIWKLYNHGFFVRTPSVSFTFDLVPGAPRIEGFAVSPELIARIVDQADAAFISHVHSDHANRDVARLFLARGKPVVVPEGLWAEDADPMEGLTYPERSTTVEHEIAVRSGRQVLRVVAYPGHQGTRVVNNVHLVTSPEGFTVIHTGDQSGSEDPGFDFDWIAHVGHQHQVDVAFPNCWTTNIRRVLRGINPTLVITGHENEMAHTVPHREDYTQTYNRLLGTPYPFIVMTWGESYHYSKPAPH
jgi:L-ascorbate metabolism protein UlaG (beta-lactamase superfamily)